MPHTPGPWRAELHKDPARDYTIFSDARGYAGIQVGWAHNQCGQQFSKDDAVLIAAAPELLAACKAYLAVRDKPGPDAIEAREDAERQMNAAIAKAEGA